MTPEDTAAPAGQEPTSVPTTEHPPVVPEPPAATDPWADPASARAEIERLRKEAASYRTELRRVEPLAAKAQQLEESQKSAEQKLTEKLTKAEGTAQQAQAELAKLQAALAKMPAGFDPAQLPNVLKRLTGATPEELEADAVELFALMAPAATPPPVGNGQHRPVEQLRPGALPATPELSLADQIAAAEKAGDVGLSMRLKSIQLRELTKTT